MGEKVLVNFNAKIKPVKPINSEFTLCKAYVMALGKNRNMSYFSKEAVEDAMPTLFNIPVVGHIYIDEDGGYKMGGHDIALVQNGGEYVFQSLCVPFGTVPQQDNYYFEDITEPNGETHTYLVADIILWTARYPELEKAIYSDEIYFGQSMEINPLETAPLAEEKSYTSITKYEYSALCLLGKSDDPDYHVEPCFPAARVEPYKFSADNEFQKLMDELIAELNLCYSANSDKKGGECFVDDVKREFEEQPSAETAEAPVEEKEFDQSNEENDNQTNEEANTEENFNAENQGAGTSPEVTEKPLFFATFMQKFEAIVEAVSEKNVVERDDEGYYVGETYHYVEDFDDQFIYVSRWIWKGNDSRTTDNGRFTYTFDEQSFKVTITGDFELMIVKWLTLDENAKLEEMRAEYQQLVEFRDNQLQKAHQARVDEVINQFREDLGEVKEFNDLVEIAYTYKDISALQEKCYALRGKYGVTKPKKSQLPKAPLNFESKVSDEFEEFFQTYGTLNQA